MVQDDWFNCYDAAWKGLLYENKETNGSAFAHPAKFARGLIFRIIEHALADGLIQPGGVVVDPFGGVALGALPCLMNGLSWVGVELEQKFVDLGCKNIALWNSRFAGMPKWTGTATLMQGDSRRLVEAVAGAGLVVGSPPYAEQPTRNGRVDENSWSDGRSRPVGASQKGSAGYGQTPGQLGAMVVGSPPFAGNTGGRGEASRNGIDAALFDRHSGGMKRGTGSDPANLDHLPMGTLVVGSPPYAGSMEKSGGIDPEKSNHIGGPHSQMNRSDTRYGSAPGQLGSMVVGSPPFAGSVGSDDPAKRGGLYRDPKRAGDVNLTGSYGETVGQLGAMVVGSPPYEGTPLRNENPKKLERLQRLVAEGKITGRESVRLAKNGFNPNNQIGNQSNYGSSEGQIGETSGETFWTAARAIVEQCAAILPPGGAAIWVVKAYVKNGKLVDFPGQWQALCEACGFETVHIHRAMLVKENGAQADMFGGNRHSEKVERKSFFRRLHEAKQKAAVHWETLDRDTKARALWTGHFDLWLDYRRRLDQEPEKKAPRPTRRRILTEAQMIAWKKDGKPDYDIETAIDFETVICTRKRTSNA